MISASITHEIIINNNDKNEINEMIILLQKDNPITLLPKLININTKSHKYFKYWKNIIVNIDIIKNIILIVRRYEANGLQLSGKGLWFLSMILSNCNTNENNQIKFNDYIHNILFDTILRVLCEHNVYYMCTSLLTSYTEKLQIPLIKIFETGKLNYHYHHHHNHRQSSISQPPLSSLLSHHNLFIYIKHYSLSSRMFIIRDTT